MPMKEMTSPKDAGVSGAQAHMLAQNLVYVRETPAAELVSAGLVPEGTRLDPGSRYFTVCAIDGRPLAVTDDREQAFAAARQHDMTPLSVH